MAHQKIAALIGLIASRLPETVEKKCVKKNKIIRFFFGSL